MSHRQTSRFVTVTEDNFRKEVIESPLPVVVEFYADWCSLCHINQPVMDELLERYGDRAKFVKVDTDADPGLTKVYGIRRRPTVLVMRHGIPKVRIPGMVPQKVYADLIEKSLSG